VLLEIRGIKGDADAEHHDGEEKNAGEKFHAHLRWAAGRPQDGRMTALPVVCVSNSL
jgi:hypothetical protein